MEAGREMDELVCKALGFEVSDQHGCTMYRVPCESIGGSWLYPIRHYSTSPADALAALEATGQHWHTSRYATNYECIVVVNSKWFQRSGATVCEAICAAILAWAEARPKGGAVLDTPEWRADIDDDPPAG